MANNAEFMAELLNRESNPDPLRAALVAIQELHKPYITKAQKALCLRCGITWPCKTRKMADEGLTDRLARTNQGENNA